MDEATKFVMLEEIIYSHTYCTNQLFVDWSGSYPNLLDTEFRGIERYAIQT